MDWNVVFRWIQEAPLSVWVRESDSMLAFPTIIALHAIGMGFLVGANIVVDLRVLGFAPRVPLKTLEGFFPPMHFGFWLNLVSGFLLLIAYPAKAMTNPMFYLKMGCIAAALVETFIIRKQLIRHPLVNRGPIPLGGKLLAGSSLLLWIVAITSGRLLAYTYTVLLVD